MTSKCTVPILTWLISNFERVFAKNISQQQGVSGFLLAERKRQSSDQRVPKLLSSSRTQVSVERKKERKKFRLHKNFWPTEKTFIMFCFVFKYARSVSTPVWMIIELKQRVKTVVSSSPSVCTTAVPAIRCEVGLCEWRIRSRSVRLCISLIRNDRWDDGILNDDGVFT